MTNKHKTATPIHPDVTKELLSAAVSSSATGIVIADARKKDMPLVFVNPAFEAMTGYSAEEAIGHNCRFLQGDADNQDNLIILRQALKRGESCTVTLQNFRKDGRPFWNELHIAPIENHNGEITHYIGLQTDVTDRIEGERAKDRLQHHLHEKNTELEEVNELKNQLLGMAAHDIRNPLMTVIWNCEALLNPRYDISGEKRHAMTNRIKDTAKYMLQMVNDLLDVSKIESGKLQLELDECNLASLIGNYGSVYKERAASKDIQLELKFHCPHDPWAQVDKARILQVMDNLTSNAIKFSDSNTRIDIVVTSDANDVKISVQDQGLGIPKQEQEKLFQPFSRTTVKATAGEQSTGLGLAICRKIIEAHGGEINVESESGKGSIFSFRLSKLDLDNSSQ